jgi:hypothetical protein
MCPSEHPSAREAHVNKVIVEYLNAVQARQAPDRREVLARHPDLAAELAAQVLLQLLVAVRPDRREVAACSSAAARAERLGLPADDYTVDGEVSRQRGISAAHHRQVYRGSGAGQGRDTALRGDAWPIGVAAALVVPVAVREACQWSSRRSLSCPAGVVERRVSTSFRYAHGSTPAEGR